MRPYKDEEGVELNEHYIVTMCPVCLDRWGRPILILRLEGRETDAGVFRRAPRGEPISLVGSRAA